MSTKKEIDTSIWYGLSAEGILNLLGVSPYKDMDEGINILAIRQEEHQPSLIIFELSDGEEIPYAGDPDIASADEIFNYFFDFKKLVEWTGDYLDRVVKNRKVILSLKSALESGRTIRSYERFQKQTELPIEENSTLILDHPRMPVERFFWIIGGREKNKNLGFEYETREYITSDEKKMMLTVPITISEMPRYYYDPTSSYPFSHRPVIKINNIKVEDTDILTRLVKDKEIHSIFFQDGFLSGNAFNSFNLLITERLKKVIYATFPDCFFSEEIRKSTLLDLYYQSWTVDATDDEESVMIFNGVTSFKDFILKEIKSEKDKIFKDGVNGSTWLSKTSLESLMQKFTYFVRQT